MRNISLYLIRQLKSDNYVFILAINYPYEQLITNELFINSFGEIIYSLPVYVKYSCYAHQVNIIIHT